MSLFGNNWLDTPVDDDRPLLGRNWLDETNFEYFLNSEGEYQKIETKCELYEAFNNNNIFTFDGENYNLKTK